MMIAFSGLLSVGEPNVGRFGNLTHTPPRGDAIGNPTILIGRWGKITDGN